MSDLQMQKSVAYLYNQARANDDNKFHSFDKMDEAYEKIMSFNVYDPKTQMVIDKDVCKKLDMNELVDLILEKTK